MSLPAHARTDARNLWQTQNFLHDVSVVERVLRLAGVARDDLVVEIGPGRGIITRPLARLCARVLAVEYDPGLCDHLRRSLRDRPNVRVVQADFLRYRLPEGDYKIVSSLPFNITSQVLARLTGDASPPQEAHLVLQAEAARRFAGPPHDRESLRSLHLKARFAPALVHAFRRTDFRPVPEVDTVLLRLRRRRPPLLSPAEERGYRDFLSFAFAQRGADVTARLRGVFTPEQLRRLGREHGFSTSAPLVDLSFDHWLALFRYYLIGVASEKRRLVTGAESRLARQQARLTTHHRSRPRQEKPAPVRSTLSRTREMRKR
jgi:23S rRNA (adenine-N6)-dimethyltransferase